MEILISTSTSKPIYEQITSQIKAQIMSGALQPGRRSPHARAGQVHPRQRPSRCKRPTRTCKGTASSKRRVGRGTFVAPLNRDFYQEEQQRQAEEHLLRAADIGPHERDSAGDAPQNSDDVLSGRRMNMEATLQVST